MDIAWLHLRTRAGGKPKEGYYTMLVIEETSSKISGIKSEMVPESVAKIMRASPEVFTEMGSSEAKQWCKAEMPSAYRSGWRSWPKRADDHGVGAKILKRFKIGGNG